VILDAAFHIVSKAGLEGLTIGTLAAATGMSKSGCSPTSARARSC
jgi:hypothetical protein